MEGLIAADLLPRRLVLGGLESTGNDLLTARLQISTHGGVLAGPLGRQTRGQTVEGGPDLVVVTHQGQVERGDAQAPLANLLHQAIGFQERHGLLDRLARHAEALGQLLLHQMGARRQHAFTDVVKDRAIDLIGQARRSLDQTHDLVIRILNSEFNTAIHHESQAFAFATARR